MRRSRFWGADTVAFGRTPHEPRPAGLPRGDRLSLPRFTTIRMRPVALVMVAIVTGVALTMMTAGGSDSQKEPVREVAGSGQRNWVTQGRRAPLRARRRERSRAMKPRVRKKGSGQRKDKRGKARKPKCHPRPHRQPNQHPTMPLHWHHQHRQPQPHPPLSSGCKRQFIRAP